MEAVTLNYNDNNNNSNTEIEPPPPPPGAVGNVSWDAESLTTCVEASLSGVDAKAFWPADSTSGRQVVLVQLANPDEFVAFGIYPVVSHPLYDSLVPFVVWGKQSELDPFLAKMVETGAQWQEYAEAPTEPMQECVALIQDKRLQQAMLAAMDWAQGSSNDNLSLSAA